MGVQTGQVSARPDVVEVALRPADAWTGSARRIGSALALCWAVLLGAAVSLGSHPSSLTDLRAELRSGKVEVVHVTGGLPEGGRGYGWVDLQWRSGPWLHHVGLYEATPGRQHVQAQRQAPEATVVAPGLRERLVALSPRTRVEELDLRSSYSTLFGLRTPFWTFWAVLVLWLSTWALLRLGPQPRRATRAAWGWLIFLAPPLGVPAYLLLGGPTGLVPPPRMGRRELTGGWALLLGLVLAGA